MRGSKPPLAAEAPWTVPLIVLSMHMLNTSKERFIDTDVRQPAKIETAGPISINHMVITFKPLEVVTNSL